MALGEWKVPGSVQPKASEYAFDLARALDAVVSLSAIIPADAFTAETLGTERSGHAVHIGRRGLFVTVGYLVTEAETIWLAANDGRVAPAHLLGFDPASGLALLQVLGSLDIPHLPLGSSAAIGTGNKVVVAGAGGRQRSVAAKVVARQEFAGYWEYLLDDAFFTGPAHPHWGGTAVIDASGELVAVGSLQLQQERGPGGPENLNMSVPIDLLKPVIDDILATGRPGSPARPWLGVFVTEMDDQIVVAGLATGGPAEAAGMHVGDIVQSVAGEPVTGLAGLFRRIWSLGTAGVGVPIGLHRNGRSVDVVVQSTDRDKLLKRKILH